jgi:hypothetical protein
VLNSILSYHFTFPHLTPSILIENCSNVAKVPLSWRKAWCLFQHKQLNVVNKRVDFILHFPLNQIGLSYISSVKWRRTLRNTEGVYFSLKFPIFCISVPCIGVGCIGNDLRLCKVRLCNRCLCKIYTRNGRFVMLPIAVNDFTW